MKKLLVGVIVTTLFNFMALSFVAWAEDAVLKPGHPDEYTVKKGDTLWDISNTFLSTPWKWPEIWHANPQIENPHLIYPNDVIRLIYLDGQPRITSERTLKLIPDANGAAAATAGAIDADAKLTPKIRVEQNAEAISTIPLDRIDSFLSHSRIVEMAYVNGAPYIIAGPQKRIVAGAGDQAYARGRFSGNLANYGIFRKDHVVVDPKTKEVLGVYAKGIGSLSVQSFQGDVATVNINRAYEEVRIGDYLLPSEERPIQSMFFPSAPDNSIQGTIIDVEGGVSQVGKYNVVMLNRGEREGLKAGNVLAIYKEGEIVKDRVRGGSVKLPDERAGLVIVFRTFKKMSFGLVLEADRPLAVGDKLLNP